jgi:hypothetical protein
LSAFDDSLRNYVAQWVISNGKPEFNAHVLECR